MEATSGNGAGKLRLQDTLSGVPLVVESLKFEGGLPSANTSAYKRKPKRSSPKPAKKSSLHTKPSRVSQERLVESQQYDEALPDPKEQKRADDAVKAIDELIRAEINSARKLYAWNNLTAGEKVLFILDILTRLGIVTFMGTFTTLLYMGTGTAAGLKMQQEWGLPIIWAKILEILADIEGSSSNAVLNSEGGIDFKKTIEDIATKFSAKHCGGCCVSDATLKKLGLIDTISYNPDETVKEKRIRVAKSIARVTGKVFFTVSSAGVYYFLAKKYGIPTFITGAAANGLGVGSLSWLNPKLPAVQQTIIDYLKKNQLEPILNLLEVDPEEGMNRLRRLREYVDRIEPNVPPKDGEAHAAFRINLDLLYLALSLTSANPLTDAPKEYLEKTQPTPARNAFAKIIYGFSVFSIGGYVYDVAYGVYQNFANLYAKIAMGLLATAAALPPFFGLSTGAANRVGAELLSDQATLASLVKTTFLQYTRYTLIVAGYAFTAGSGFTNWLLNLIFANTVISWLSSTTAQCFNQTVVNATDLVRNYTAPIFAASVYPTVQDEMSRAVPIIFQNLTAGEICPDQRSWFGIFVANLYAMVGMIGAPVTNLFYWLLMTDNLTVFLAEHGCTNEETQEMIAHVKMFRNIVSGVENTDPTQFARMLNKIFTPIGQNPDGSYIYTHLAQQLFAILDTRLSHADKLELDKIIKQPPKQAVAEETSDEEQGALPDIWEASEHVWDQLKQEKELNSFKSVQEKGFLDEAKTKVVEKNRGTGHHVDAGHPLLDDPNKPKNRGCWGRCFSWFRGSERAPLIPEKAEDYEMAYRSGPDV